MNARCPPGFFCVHEPRCPGAANPPDPTTAAIISTTAELTELRQLRDTLRQVVHDLPFGYFEGKVRTHRSTKDADIIAWIKRLEALAGLERDVSLPRPARREDENHG